MYAHIYMTHNVFVNTETVFVFRLQKRRRLYCTLDSHAQSSYFLKRPQKYYYIIIIKIICQTHSFSLGLQLLSFLLPLKPLWISTSTSSTTSNCFFGPWYYFVFSCSFCLTLLSAGIVAPMQWQWSWQCSACCQLALCLVVQPVWSYTPGVLYQPVAGALISGSSEGHWKSYEPTQLLMPERSFNIAER